MRTQLNLNNQQTFTARLFNPKNEEIKAFDMLNELKGTNQMASRGSSATNIYVNDFISIKDGFGEYKNSVDITIENPLFGSQQFVQNLSHKTNSPIKGTHSEEIWHLDLLTGLRSNNCNDLENKGIKGAIIDYIVEEAPHSRKESLNPLDILDKMLKQTIKEKHGFSEARIAEFKNIAENLLDELIKKGINSIKK